MPHHHYKIYKPYGVLSQFKNNQNRRKNKKLLGELYDFPENTMSVGRLDQDSEGLLLLTSCGKTSYAICSRKIEKEYYVQVDGLINATAIEKMKFGVKIGIHGKKYTTLPCKVEAMHPPQNLPPRQKKIRDDRHGATSWISVTLTEGKFRQVRKMTAAVGFPTLRLIRVRIGAETLEDLQPGNVKKISDFPWLKNEMD